MENQAHVVKWTHDQETHSVHQLYLISYDIASCRNRTRVLHHLHHHATGGQKSVYECWLDADQLQEVRRVLPPLLADDDRLLIARLDPRAIAHALGVAAAPCGDPLVYVG